MLDPVDAQILHALQINGRAPFSSIAAVLGVSDQTVARRYHRLRSSGLLRVRGLVEPAAANRAQLIVRIRCTPTTAATVADAIARRADTSWVSLTAGGTEIVSVITTRRGDQPALLQKLPLSRGVLGIDAHHVLHEFFGGAQGLVAKNGPLSGEQISALRPARRRRAGVVAELEAGDESLLHALEQDGRTPVARLAAVTRRSESTVRRRIDALVDARLLYFDVDVDHRVLDLQMRAIIWLQVPVDRLAEVGDALAGHPEVGYVAATTGRTNLYVAVSCPTAEALYVYLTGRVAALSAINDVESSTVVRSIKTGGGRAGSAEEP